MRQQPQKSRAEGWHRSDIVAFCWKQGQTIAGIGRLNGIPEGTMRASLHKPHPTANRAIANYLGVSVHTLWPQWFDASGKRIPGANTKERHPKSLRQKRIGHLASTGKKSGASAKGEQV